MSRNIVAAETAEENRTGRQGGYTFHAPVDPEYEGVMFTVATVRLGDHAHVEIHSGRPVPESGNLNARGPRGLAGRLILRWHEWEKLRPVLDDAAFIHIAEVENPTVGQLRHHVGSREPQGVLGEPPA